MRAVVTGGAGFIGSHLIENLVASGADVVCVERRGASRQWIGSLPITVAECGVSDPDALAPFLEGVDVVFHLAGLTEARTPADYYAVNTDGTSVVLKAAARKGSRAPRVILMSSIAAVGPAPNGELIGPDTIPRPLSAYGQSKLRAEAVVHAYRDRVPATIVRFPSVYGPRERGVLKFFQLVRRGVALTIGGWDRQLNLIYVADVVAGLRRLADAPAAAGRTYCLAHPEVVTWRGFAAEVGRALKREPMLVSVPRSIARVVARCAEVGAAIRRRAAILNRERVEEITQERWLCDVSRASAEVGFAPAFPTARGIPETAAWYQEHGWL
ncbi:MAG TPA: NAD(P)-dependent oxidoreductase [Gemmatimonadales bacterium]|nr:NAD(P)-dependent oxidoreductase [Gemmatimonadales bacterium]